MYKNGIIISEVKQYTKSMIWFVMLYASDHRESYKRETFSEK